LEVALFREQCRLRQSHVDDRSRQVEESRVGGEHQQVSRLFSGGQLAVIGPDGIFVVGACGGHGVRFLKAVGLLRQVSGAPPENATVGCNAGKVPGTLRWVTIGVVIFGLVSFAFSAQ
jgi:hypothetical protein